MSVQLIVYPQNYDGTFNSITSTPTQFVVNGINFTGLNSAPNYDSSSATPSQDTINNAQPTIPNTWYRFRSTIPSLPSLPSLSNNKIILYIDPAAVGSVLGVYQKLGNLTVGQQYELSLTMAGGSDGSIISEVYDGTTLISSSVTAVGASIISHTFTSTAPDNIIMVYYSTTISDIVEIDTIGITEAPPFPSGAIQILGDGQVIVDLYEDEDLPLTLSVDDFKNVAEKVQSYSKAFNLPATKRNNLIFDAIFEVTRAYDGIIFNPYKRTKCVLKQDGFVLFEGFLRMLDITDKEGEISYNVNLYSEVIALADTLKDREFRDLDFTELEHDYNITQIKNSWNDGSAGQTTPITWTNSGTSGFRTNFETLKYPFVDWNHQIIVGGSYAVGATIGNPELTTLETAFRPFINIKYLIDRIFNAPNTPFTYESAFFNTTDFEKLYMDFNWGGDEFPTPENTFDASWVFGAGATSNTGTGTYKALRLLPETSVGGAGGSTLPPNYQGDPSAANPYIITATTTLEMYNVSYNFKLENTSIIASTAQCRWIHTVGGVIQPFIDYSLLVWSFGLGQRNYMGSFNIAT